MKNFTKLFSIIALVAVIGFSMVGCATGSGTNNTGDNSVVGTWVAYGNGNEARFDFNANGTVISYSNGTPNDSATWTQSGNTVTIIEHSGARSRITIRGDTWSYQGVTFIRIGGGSDSARYALVNSDSLNVRSGPSADNAVVGQLTRNTRVQVLESSGTWWKIRSGNIEGYVNSSYLREES